MNVKKYFYLLFMLCLSGYAYAQTYPVVWTDMINVTVNADNSLTKTIANGNFDDTGAGSQNIIPASQDGYVQFTHIAGVNTYFTGLSKLNKDTYWFTDYSIYVSSNVLYVYALGNNLGNFGVLTVGDVLKIAREGSTIKFYKNGTVIHTISSGVVVTDPLRVDVNIGTGKAAAPVCSARPMLVIKPALVHPGLANNNGSISLQLEGQYEPVTYSWSDGSTGSSITGKSRGTYTVTVTDAQSRVVTKTYTLDYPIAWTSLTNVTVNADNSLTKTDAYGWTAGASSLNVLPANTNGYIEFVANETGAYLIAGLSRIDKGAAYQGINYAWLFNANGTLSILESGTNRGGFGNFIKGDILRIAREGANIAYYHNGILKRTVAAVTLPLVVDASNGSTVTTIPVISASFDKQIRAIPSLTFPTFANTGGSIALNVDGAHPPSTITWSSGETTAVISNKARGTYTANITDAATHTFVKSYRLGYPVNWTDLQNTLLNADNTLSKSIVSNLWDASAISSQGIPPSTDGWIEFPLPDPKTAPNLMIGLARPNTIATLASIDYAFFFIQDDVYIYEAGLNRGVFASQAEGDLYTIAREGTNIKYYVNGTVIRTIATPVTYQLFADVSINAGGIVPVISASFGEAPKTFYAIANGAWTSPSTWSLTEGGAATTSFPGATDLVNIKGFGVTINTGVYCAGLNLTVTNDNSKLTIDGPSAGLFSKGNIVVKGENNLNTVNAITVQNDAKLGVLNP